MTTTKLELYCTRKLAREQAKNAQTALFQGSQAL